MSCREDKLQQKRRKLPEHGEERESSSRTVQTNCKKKSLRGLEMVVREKKGPQGPPKTWSRPDGNAHVLIRFAPVHRPAVRRAEGRSTGVAAEVDHGPCKSSKQPDLDVEDLVTGLVVLKPNRVCTHLGNRGETQWP